MNGTVQTCLRLLADGANQNTKNENRNPSEDAKKKTAAYAKKCVVLVIRADAEACNDEHNTNEDAEPFDERSDAVHGAGHNIGVLVAPRSGLRSPRASACVSLGRLCDLLCHLFGRERGKVAKTFKEMAKRLPLL